MRVTVQSLLDRKKDGRKIVMLTAYDFPFARITDEAGVDAILVGDSLAMVVQGLDNTIAVTMDEMIYHTKIVSRAATHAMVIADMPYLSYQISVEDALRNAGRFLKEGGAQAVKLEGGREVADRVRAMTMAEIPVMAHIGLTPQALHRMGGYKVQGKTEEAAQGLMEDAKILEDAGAFCLTLEAIPAELARRITSEISIPTIGIGAGPHCDGQVLVMHDVLGLFERFMPKFAKQYANLKDEALRAIIQYKEEVEKGTFPDKDHSF
ncbi:MAG TPA: 3-methyl-2-oxobutanoate hydroxymethyltransferase [Dissulfurispiraceae bacterium]|nr:3-methyl-2-oxobutanoate hydroxymethyltransferase [Dissulfurispiraceae bacterium]